MKGIQQNKYKKVAITGIGIVSALGDGQVNSIQSLLRSKSALTSIDFVDTIHSEKLLAGEVKFSNEDLEKQLELHSGHNFTRTAMLGCLAAKEAVRQAKIADITTRNTAFISATTVGGMDKTEKYFKQFNINNLNRRFIKSHVSSDSSTKIADYLGVEGFVSTVSTACSSAANAIMLGARLINGGKVERAIVGGTDSLSKFTINGFNSLMLLTDGLCTPFDRDRNGLNLGEGAAYLVLESESIVKEYNKNVLAYLKGFANTNDAFHQTASSENGEGAYLAMKDAIAMAELSPDDIDYINAHGTATPNNDQSEGIAIKRLFGKNIPMFSSTKSYTGHCLGSAAAVEAVISVLSLQGDVVFPNLNFSNPIPDFNGLPVTTLTNRPIKYVLSNSFGFGGNCSTLIFSKS